mmetsp:Transcript_16048/g.24303  ORF Transcript_16048/g.24303 Transcript_16048/m.24303 type:complete len:104 (+) Transcript_16048:43-354(+)
MNAGCFIGGAGAAEGRDNRDLMFFSIVVTRDLNIGMEKDRKSMFIKLAEFIGVITADRFFFWWPIHCPCPPSFVYFYNKLATTRKKQKKEQQQQQEKNLVCNK